MALALAYIWQSSTHDKNLAAVMASINEVVLIMSPNGKVEAFVN